MAESQRVDKRYDLRTNINKTQKAREMEENKEKVGRRSQTEYMGETDEETLTGDEMSRDLTSEETNINIDPNVEEIGMNLEDEVTEDTPGRQKVTSSIITKEDFNQLIAIIMNREEKMDKNMQDQKNSMDSLKQDQKNNMDSIQNSMDSLKQDQKNSMDSLKQDQKNSMDSLKQDQKNNMDSIQNSMDSIQNNMDIQMGSLQNKMDSNSDEMKKEINSINQTISREITCLRNSVKENKNAIQQIKLDMDLKVKEMELKFNSYFQETTKLQENQIMDTIELKANKLADALHEKIVQTRSVIYSQVEQLEEEMVKQQSTVEENFQRTNQQIADTKQEVKIRRQEETEQVNKKIDELWKEVEKKLHVSPQNIIVTCTGSNNNDLSIPKYGRRSHNPTEFIGKLKSYYIKIQERGRGINIPSLEEVLEIALEDHIGKWWISIKDEIRNLEDFENRFLEKYWSHDIQRGLKRRIELEEYQSGGRLNRSEYFIERVLMLKQMTPHLDESDIITILAERYNEQIQDARRVQNIQTIADFEKLLSRFDIEDQNRRLQVNNTDRRVNERERTSNNSGNQEFSKGGEMKNYARNRNGVNNYRGNNDRNHPYDRSKYQEPKTNYEAYRHRDENQNRQVNQQQERRYVQRFQYPDQKPTYYNNTLQRNNTQHWNQRRTDWRTGQGDQPNPRFQKYKTEEQEALCQTIQVTRSDHDKQERKTLPNNEHKTTMEADVIIHAPAEN